MIKMIYHINTNIMTTIIIYQIGGKIQLFK